MEVQKNLKKGLGRGIGALIPGGQLGAPAVNNPDRNYFMCDVDRIVPNKYQPREVFEATALSELSKSIKENGVIQPLIVRRKNNMFELIAGERRWKASMLAGLKKVPVVIREVTDRQTLELAIIENVQRDDLSCIEEGRAYKHLMVDFMMTQEQVALKVGKDRATIANMVRLLLLPKEIQNDLIEKKITMGHARALLSVPSEKLQLDFRNKIVEGSLSVRQTEKMVQNHKEETPSSQEENLKTDFTYLIDELKKALQTRIMVRGTKDRGKIIIHYSSENELDRIFNLLVE